MLSRVLFLIEQKKITSELYMWTTEGSIIFIVSSNPIAGGLKEQTKIHRG